MKFKAIKLVNVTFENRNYTQWYEGIGTDNKKYVVKRTKIDGVWRKHIDCMD